MKMKRKVLKFGGSSVASAEQLRRVQQIVLEREDRGDIRAVVVSARGKDSKKGGAYSVKETDLLIMAHNVLVGRPIETDTNNADARKVVELLHEREPVSEITFNMIWQLIEAPLMEIVEELGLEELVPGFSICRVLDESKRQIHLARDLAFTKSRGEWHMAHIVSALLTMPLAGKMPMVDAADVFRFTRSGRLNEEQTLERIATKCGDFRGIVIPGFYGADIDGKIHTFPRNGSDVTATWVARGLNVDVCEIWSDTPGVYMADPRIIPRPEWIVLDRLTYREVREAQVQALHEDAVRPLREMREPIPIHMRDVGEPDAHGTWIVAKRESNGRRVQIITGHRGFVAINIYKTGYHDEVGTTVAILSVLSVMGIPFDYISTGTDGIMIVIRKSAMKNGTLDHALGHIKTSFKPEQLAAEPERELAVVYLVGEMHCSFEVIGRACCALDSVGISGRFVDAGGSSGTIVIGVDADKLSEATLALHREFAKDVQPS